MKDLATILLLVAPNIKSDYTSITNKEWKFDDKNPDVLNIAMQCITAFDQTVNTINQILGDSMLSKSDKFDLIKSNREQVEEAIFINTARAEAEVTNEDVRIDQVAIMTGIYKALVQRHITEEVRLMS